MQIKRRMVAWVKLKSRVLKTSLLRTCSSLSTKLNKFSSALAQSQIPASQSKSLPVPRRYHIKWYWSTIALVLQCIRLDTAVSSAWYCSGEKDRPKRQRGAMRKSCRCDEKVMPLRWLFHAVVFAHATRCVFDGTL